MEQTLNPIERRVLGVLIEKALSQPDYYPMTSNAIVAACNQQSNRDPVMHVEEIEVLRTLEVLRLRGLVSMALAAPGARVNRYRHLVEKALDWNRRQQAIMAELLLRGPQTPGELRARCARMFQFESLEAVVIALDSLGDREAGPAVVASLPREPGHSAIRYAHLLYPQGETPAPARAPVAAAPTAAKPALPPAARSVPAPAVSAKPQAACPPPTAEEAAPAIEALRAEINDLNGEIADLHEEIQDLRGRIETLERKTAAI